MPPQQKQEFPRYFERYILRKLTSPIAQRGLGVHWVGRCVESYKADLTLEALPSRLNHNVRPLLHASRRGGSFIQNQVVSYIYRWTRAAFK